MTPANFDDSDLTTKARVRAAALDLAGEQGLDATSISQIAQRAGVSVGLVQHHFKTKAQLADDVRAWVLARLVDTPAVAVDRDAARPDVAAFDELMFSNPKLAAYIRRILIEATPNAKRWFNEAVDQTVEQLRKGPPDGLGDHPDQLRTVAAMLLVVTLGPVILGSALPEQLDCSAEEAHRRWRQIEAEMPFAASLPRRPR